MFAVGAKSSSLLKVPLYQLCRLQPLSKILNSNTILMSPRLCGFPWDPRKRCGRTQNKPKPHSIRPSRVRRRGWVESVY
jgi:hypothetical protein